MPIKPIIYLNTIIYKIVHKEDYDNVNIYIGSTTNFKTRKNSHKSKTNKIGNAQYNFKKYQYIRDNGGWDMFDMIEIEKYPCKDKNEAESRERYWIEFYKSTLNSSIPTRSIKEWHQDNKEYRKNKCKEYQEKNKIEIAKQRKIYYNNNKEELSEKAKIYVEKNKEKTKEYQKKYGEINKDELAKKNKIYYEKNKEEFAKKCKIYYDNKKKEKVICECGCEITKISLNDHLKTKKHIKLMLLL